MLYAAFLNRKLACWAIAGAVLAPSFLITGRALPLEAKSSNTPRAQKNDGRLQIDRLEDKWRNAILKGDVNLLDSLLAEDYVAITARGRLETKNSTLDGIRSREWHYTKIDVFNRKVRLYGRRMALVTLQVEVEGVGPDGTASGTYRYTLVFELDSRGTWKIVNLEASHVGHHPQPRP